mgnify:CR=1 FL=1
MTELQNRRTSVSAIIALVLAVLTIPGVFCCAGFGTGVISIVLGIIALVQYKNGEADDASKIMGWASIVVSALAMIGYLLYMVIFVGTVALRPEFLN